MENSDDKFSEESKSNDNIETEVEEDDLDFTNEDITLNEGTLNEVTVNDGTVNNLTDKLTNNNIDQEDLKNIENIENVEESENKDLEMTQRSEDVTERSEFLDIDQEIVDKENLYKLESDPYYLPGDFPNLPEEFDCSSFPESYRENSMKEELCLKFIENFIRQYRFLYGDRRPLFIKPLNECKVSKMVCTTINVTKLPFTDVYYWEGAAEFVADYLTMVPLIPCTDTPRRLLAPMTTLELGRGTSFEYSTLLCCLLLGVGYNAYVVNGYATRETCFMDISRDNCPQLSVEEKSVDVKNVKTIKKYTVRPPKDLTSKFELEQEAKKNKIEQDRLKQIEAEIKEEERLDDIPRNDPLYGQRVHAWVLILPGKREIGEPFFIEALTGKAYSTKSTNYLGIESLWNNKNYFVNMQVGIGGVSNLNYDLNNTGFWEYVFSGQEAVVVGPPVDTPAGYDPAEMDEIQNGNKFFDLPKSWTKPIVVSLKEFELRSSEGRKEILYKKARFEKYSPYISNDGMVTRIRKYDDKMLHKSSEIIEYFQHRRDKLVKRVTDSNTEMVSEYFDKGRKSRLAEHHFYNDKINKSQMGKMKFYFDARIDGLMEMEDSDVKLITKYTGRDDCLIEKIVTYGKREKKFGPANEREYQRPFETIIEHYSRNRNIEAEKDIREVIFHITDYRILVSFHTADENIVGDMVEFLKNPSTGDPRRGSIVKLGKDACTYFQVDPYKPKLTNVEIYEYFIYLLEKEELSKLAIRKEETEIKEILKLRDEEYIANEMKISLFDRVRNTEANTTRVEMERMIEEDKYRVKDEELDYLEPFMLQLNIEKDDEISKNQALELHQKCLQDFKQRIITKANLLQERFEKETEKLQGKQQWYQANQSIMQKSDEQEYLQFCNEVTFKINTLEKMLARHKQTSKFKEMELDQKLRSDKRIAKYFIIK